MKKLLLTMLLTSCLSVVGAEQEAKSSKGLSPELSRKITLLKAEIEDWDKGSDKSLVTFKELELRYTNLFSDIMNDTSLPLEENHEVLQNFHHTVGNL